LKPFFKTHGRRRVLAAVVAGKAAGEGVVTGGKTGPGGRAIS